MTKINEANCAHCGKLYSLIYTNKDGRAYTINTTYCSKSCASSSSAKNNKGCIQPDVGADVLRQKAIKHIESTGAYCTTSRLCLAIGHSSKSLVKHGIKVSELNAGLGFSKPNSTFQKTVSDVLEKKFTDVQHEKTFDGLVGSTGHPLRVDFFIPEINTVVEADGTQHRSPNHPWSKHKNGTVAQYDKIKDDYFAEKGIRLARVPYKRNIKESDVLSRLS